MRAVFALFEPRMPRIQVNQEQLLKRMPFDTTSGARLQQRAEHPASPSWSALSAMYDSPPRKELIRSNYGAPSSISTPSMTGVDPGFVDAHPWLVPQTSSTIPLLALASFLLSRALSSMKARSWDEDSCPVGPSRGSLDPGQRWKITLARVACR